MAKPARDDPAQTPPGSRIGRHVRLTGDLSGDGDLLIEGSITGTVMHRSNVTIGPHGRVSGEISGRIVTVEGQLDGNLSALDFVLVRGSARLSGHVTGPQILLDDDAQTGDAVLTGKMGRTVRL
jgi:cytoskeletal protein CcmA (bactofilin family)